ncbi:MAG: tetratricopeptide repeat protein [Planctomycetes bacterium]|nr:tetratricopeptide repeat protein [Planctomycetota bacterium]
MPPRVNSSPNQRFPLCRILCSAWLAFILVVAAGYAGDNSSTPEAPGPQDIFSPASQQFDFASGLFARKLYSEAEVEYKSFLENFPDDVRRSYATFNLAKTRFALKRFARAEVEFNEFINANPGSELLPEAQMQIGCCRFERKAYTEATAALEPLVNNPVFAEVKVPEEVRYSAYYYLGRAHQELGELEKAAESLTQSLRSPPPLQVLARFALGEVEADRQQYPEAETHLRTLRQEYPQHPLYPAAGLRLAEVLRQTGRLDEAAELYQELTKLDGNTPESREAFLGLGLVRFGQEDFLASVNEARKGLAFKDPALTAPLRYLLGISLLRQKEYGQADAILANIKEGEYAAAAAVQRIWGYLGAARLDEAEAQANFCMKTFPQQEPGTVAYLFGTALFRKAEYETAITAFSKGRELTANPYREESAFQLALASERLGKDADAVAAYTVFCEDFPDSDSLPAALIGLGNAHLRLKNYAGAIAAYNQVTGQDSASAAQTEHARLQEALCHYALEEYEEMDKCYRAILEESPRSAAAPEALYWVAWGKQRAGNYPEAIALFQQFQTNYPKHTRSDQVLYLLGMNYYQNNDEEKAAEIFYRILQEHPAIKMQETELLWLGNFFLQKDKPGEANQVYNTLLARQPGSKIRTMAQYYSAEAQRRRAVHLNTGAAWKKAAESFRLLTVEEDPRFNVLSHFGLGQCLRRLGDLAGARAAFAKVDFDPDDPMMASLLFERGMLEKASGNLDTALRLLMQVGLLYDEIDLCGEALLAAGEICEAQKDFDKAATCYRELFGDQAGSYGKRYGEKSRWSVEARQRYNSMQQQRQAEASTPQPAPPAPEEE